LRKLEEGGRSKKWGNRRAGVSQIRRVERDGTDGWSRDLKRGLKKEFASSAFRARRRKIDTFDRTCGNPTLFHKLFGGERGGGGEPRGKKKNTFPPRLMSTPMAGGGHRELSTVRAIKAKP